MSKKRINHLTDEEKSILPDIANTYIKRGLSCEPADRPTVEEGIRECYRRAKLDSDIPIFWVDSPLVGSMAAPLANLLIGHLVPKIKKLFSKDELSKENHIKVVHLLGEHTHGSVHSTVHSAVTNAVVGAVTGAVSDAVAGAVHGAVHGAVDGAVSSSVRDAVGGAVTGAVDGAVSDAVAGAVYGAVAGAVTGAVDGAVSSSVRDAVGGAVTGAVTGAVADAVAGAVADAVDGAVTDAVTGAVDGAVHDAVADAVAGAVYGAVAGAVHGAVHSAVTNAVVGAVTGAVSDAVAGAVHGAVHGAVDGAVSSSVRDAVGGAVTGAVDGAVSDAVAGAVYGAVAGAVTGAVDGAVSSSVRDAVDSEVYIAVDGAVSSSVRGAVRDAVDSEVYIAVAGTVHGAVGSAIGVAVHNVVRDAVTNTLSNTVDGATNNTVNAMTKNSTLYKTKERYNQRTPTAISDSLNKILSPLVKSVTNFCQKIISNLSLTLSKEEIKKAFTNMRGTYLGGLWWGGWQGYISTFKILGLDLSEEIWAAAKAYENAQSAGWWWPYTWGVIVCDTPVEIHREQVQRTGWGSHRLHRTDGPAISFRDGWSIYSVHGVRVPDYVVMNPEKITLEQIQTETNAEVRRIMRQQYGEGRYLTDTGAKVLDVEMVETLPNTDRPGLMRALMQDNENQKWLVGSDGSTQRVYWMLVPNTVTTCKEAHEAICGLDEAQCRGRS